VDCIANLPYIKGGVSRSPRAANWSERIAGPRRIDDVHDDLIRHVIDHPFSHFSEEIRSIKAAVDLLAITKSNKVVGVTSTFQNEGKTTIAASLALLIAASRLRVLLVDGDLRNPSLSRQLAPDAAMGLVEVISGMAPLEKVVRTYEASGLRILPTVIKTRLAQTSDILGSEATRKLFKKLRETFDYVIIDLSPLVPVVDARTAMQLVDSCVFTVEWGRTKIDAVERALERAPMVHENLLGVVLNKVDIAIQNRYESYQDSYYRKKYYGKYGCID
jgi:polysaccharide biosynthesis transport protein